MDTEIVAIDPVDGSLRNFQTLASRARKDVRLDNISADVGVFAFDLMYLNDQVCAWMHDYTRMIIYLVTYRFCSIIRFAHDGLFSMNDSLLMFLGEANLRGSSMWQSATARMESYY